MRPHASFIRKGDDAPAATIPKSERGNGQAAKAKLCQHAPCVVKSEGVETLHGAAIEGRSRACRGRKHQQLSGLAVLMDEESVISGAGTRVKQQRSLAVDIELSGCVHGKIIFQPEGEWQHQL